jgi:DNA-binding LytR/AlgR family response regulator
VILRVVIVDDEAMARRRLVQLITRRGGAVVIGEAADAEDGEALVAAVDPDVVLLDVRMPGRDGLSLARGLGSRPVRPAVIFTTAHAEFAVGAFDAEAVDYLLKPIAADQLARALDRAAARIAASGARLEPPRIPVRAGNVVSMVPALAVTRFRSIDKYTAFVAEGVEHLTEQPLVELEEQLAPWGFLRVHRSELIQLARVRGLHLDGATGEVELDDGQRVRISKRLLPSLRRRLNR